MAYRIMPFRYAEDSKTLDRYLKKGWEPFAVTSDGAVETVWLRQKYTPSPTAEDIMKANVLSPPKLGDDG